MGVWNVRRAVLVAGVCVAALGAATATRPVGDFSTPEGTVRSLTAALRAGDAAGMGRCYVMTTALGGRFLEAYVRSTITASRLAEAERAHFPAAEVKGLPMAPAEGLEKAYQKAKVETEGDRAWVMREGQTRETGLKLVRVAGEWKIDGEKSYALDTEAGREAAEGLIASAGPTMNVLEAVARDIEGGKIRNLAEARARLGARATTRATTRP